MPGPALNMSQVLDFMGAQGGGPLPFIATVQVADFSETAIGEFVESRAFVSSLSTTANNGEHVVWAIASRAPGGIVITDLKLALVDLPATATGLPLRRPDSFGLEIRPSTLAAEGFIETALLDVGSVPAVSGFGTQLLVGGIAPAPSIGVFGEFQIQPGVRWFVPAGSILIVESNAVRQAGDPVTVSMSATWRELAAQNLGS